MTRLRFSGFARGAGSALAVAVTLTACGEGPQVPSAAEPTASPSVAAPVAASVASVPTVRIRDAKGRGLRNVLVRWRVGSGSGRVVNDSIRTTATGEATSGGWTLGTVAGMQTLTATVDGVPTVTFTASAEAGPVARLVRVNPDPQVAVVNTPVAAAPSVRAEDQFGNVVAGVPVTFSVAIGTGSIDGAEQTSNTAGIATATAWRLGTATGQQLARATAPGAQQTAFSATATAGPPESLVRVAGDNQQGISGVPVSLAPGVRVVDAFANPVGNVPVTFTPSLGSGSVTAATTVTDPATGTAFVGSWTLSGSPTQSLVASSTLLPGRTVTFTATAVQTQFDIDVRFIGDGGTPAQRQAFVNAAAKWRRVIVGDVHTTRVIADAGVCTSWTPAIDEVVNDLLIYARITSIDGPGRVLAQAGPCFINVTSRLTAVGIMEFDEDDLPNLIGNGTLTDVVLHEMGHVLGVGTLWSASGRSLLEGRGSDDPFFVGTVARAQFANINTVTYSGNPVPVANVGGAGTRDAHWRESIFGRELMQGFAKQGGMPLSRVTAASLQDLGYIVNLAAADPFSLVASLSYSFNVSIPLLDDTADLPLYEVGAGGAPRLIRAATRSSTRTR